ncbi:hypothetical protein L227DRAFT_582168, partial [Lentinus tigrinus ALCF2SS1-6]
LENYQPGESIISRSFGRFPMRSKFVSDYIFQVAARAGRDHVHFLYHMHNQSPAMWCFIASGILVVFDLSPALPRSSSALAACSWTSSYVVSRLPAGDVILCALSEGPSRTLHENVRVV